MYAIQYIHRDGFNTGLLLKIDPSSGYSIDTHRTSLTPLDPLGITYNSKSMTLFVLAKTYDDTIYGYAVQAHEYTTEFELVKTHELPEEFNSLIWDLDRSCYWASSLRTDRVLQLGVDFNIVDAVQVDEPELVTALGTELLVQVVRDNDNRPVVVYDVGGDFPGGTDSGDFDGHSNGCVRAPFLLFLTALVGLVLGLLLCKNQNSDGKGRYHLPDELDLVVSTPSMVPKDTSIVNI